MKSKSLLRRFPFIPAVLAFSTCVFPIARAGDEPSSQNNPKLKQALKKYPQADLNGDGTLSMEEAKEIATLLGIDLTKGIPGGKTDGETFHSNIAYGPEGRQVLDFWQPRSETPTPVVLLIHGGGFKQGDKADFAKQSQVTQLRNVLLSQGIACAAINYRFISTTPLHLILRDGGRAVQFLRSKSKEWNIDKEKFGALGGSAGAGMSLWLATRDDLADPASTDPVLRESSRVGPVILVATQATYNFPRWESFLGKPGFEQKPNEASQAFHLRSDEEFSTPAGQALLKECDMLDWISPGEGPILALLDKKPGSTLTWSDYVHHPSHAREIKKACDKAGVDCQLVSDTKTETFAFFLKQLKN